MNSPNPAMDTGAVAQRRGNAGALGGRARDNRDVEQPIDMSGDARNRVAALAALLRECRDVYFAMFRNGLTAVQKPSQASFDFASTQSGPAGPWPADFVQAPRDLAVKLVRQQADFCAALGALVEAGEVFDPFSTVLRTSFEYATRALWVLDPTVEHRVRCIRATLMAVSYTHLTLPTKRIV